MIVFVWMLLWFSVVHHWHGPSAFPDWKSYVFLHWSFPLRVYLSSSSCFYRSTCPSQLGRTFPWGCQERRTGERLGEAVMSVIKDNLCESRNKMRDQQVEEETQTKASPPCYFRMFVKNRSKEVPSSFWIKLTLFFWWTHEKSFCLGCFLD